MKFLVFLALLAGAYYFYQSHHEPSSPIPILNKIKTEPVNVSEIPVAMLPEFYKACNKGPNKKFIQQCLTKLDVQKGFCLKMISSYPPKPIISESELYDKMESYYNCLLELDA